MIVVDKPTLTRIARLVRTGAERLGHTTSHSAAMRAVAAALDFKSLNAAVAHLETRAITVGVRTSQSYATRSFVCWVGIPRPETIQEHLLRLPPRNGGWTGSLLALYGVDAGAVLRGQVGHLQTDVELDVREMTGRMGRCLLPEAIAPQIFSQEWHRVWEDALQGGAMQAVSVPREQHAGMGSDWTEVDQAMVLAALPSVELQALAAAGLPESSVFSQHPPTYIVQTGRSSPAKLVQSETPSRDYGPAVRASVSLDDVLVHGEHKRVDFNAALALTRSTHDELRALAGCNWGGDYPADEVAFKARDLSGGEEVHSLMTLMEETSSGFEVRVDAEDTMAWLQAQRPLLYAELSMSAPDRTPESAADLVAGLERIGQFASTYAEFRETAQRCLEAVPSEESHDDVWEAVVESVRHPDVDDITWILDQARQLVALPATGPRPASLKRAACTTACSPLQGFKVGLDSSDAVLAAKPGVDAP